MQNYNNNSDKKNTSLDTLGQLPPTNIKNLLKRARSKWYTERITAGLLYENSPLHKYYQRAYYCNHVLEQKGQEIKAHYCDTRICHICNRIRTAKMMNGYMSQLQDRELQFVTLTLPNVNAANLRYTCGLLTHEIANTIRNFSEKKKVKINGIRKLEITYNNITNMFHPHLHLIVDKAGDEIVNAWLKRIPEANREAQDCRPANQDSLNELFKYTTKIIGHKKNEYVVYVKALDTIMQALAKKRCFQPFGDIRRVAEEVVDELQVQVYDIQEYDYMTWIWEDCDWVNKHRSTLTGYISPDVDFSYE
jgi:hypothetical protein